MGNRTKLRPRATPARKKEPAWLPWVVMSAGLLLLAGVLWVAFGGSRGSKVAVEVTGSPRLKIDRQKVDLGQVPLGKPLEVKFELANVGDQTLWLTEAPYIQVAEGC